jgi:hypothetical protein
MKKINILIILPLFLTGILFLNSCVKGDFDQPPVILPTVNFSANMTLAQLNQYYADSLHSASPVLITKDIIIKGVVISSDESGNIYKSLYLQDTTGGINVSLNQSPLYTSYKLGQMVYVKCKGLYLGNYKGVPEIGYNISGAIGQIPSSLFSTYLFLDSFPQKPPVPTITTIPAFTKGAISTLIKLDSVHFAPADTMQPFVATGAQYGTDRTIIDKNGNSVVIYSSTYANFATNLVPKGTGCVTAILSYYSGTNKFQLYIRDLNDLSGFNK